MPFLSYSKGVGCQPDTPSVLTLTTWLSYCLSTGSFFAYLFPYRPLWRQVIKENKLRLHKLFRIPPYGSYVCSLLLICSVTYLCHGCLFYTLDDSPIVGRCCYFDFLFYLFLAVPGLHCHSGVSLAAVTGGCPPGALWRLLVLWSMGPRVLRLQ